MSLNYRADKVTLPSVRGISAQNGIQGKTTDPEPATAHNVTAVSQTFTLDALALNRWVTLQANGCTVYVLGGAIGDTVTASATGACLRLDSGQTKDFMVTKSTQLIAFISTGSFTGGLVHWISDRND